MATKKMKAAAKPPAKTDRKEIEYVAKVTLLPSANAAAIVSEYAKPFGEQDISALMNALILRMNDVNAGDLQHCESMLVGQAHALQSIFVSLARRAVNQEYLKQWEAYLRMALKAQNQCRMTLETLAAIKNPPVVFAKQANISNGHQQINNGTPAPASHAGEIINQPNELLEVQHGGETVDRTSPRASDGYCVALAGYLG